MFFVSSFSIFILFIYLYLSFSSPRMTTSFSRRKLVEAQEKKARSGIVGGLLFRKCQKVSDTPFEVPMVTPPSTHSPSKGPPSPTSSLEVMVSSERGVLEKNPLASLFNFLGRC